MKPRRFGRASKGSAEEPPINITPLIDVVFVVLFTFIIIAPLLEVDAIQLAHSGGAAKTSATESAKVVLQVLADNTITLNKRPVTLLELPISLKTLQKKYPKTKAQLFHDREASFGTYQNIKNALESAGFTEMDVVLKPR